MEKKEYKRLSVEFPLEEYTYLKMACAKQNVSIKDFVTRAVVKSVEDYEDELDLQSIREARKDIAENGTVSWEQACKELGWENDL